MFFDKFRARRGPSDLTESSGGISGKAPDFDYEFKLMCQKAVSDLEEHDGCLEELIDSLNKTSDLCGILVGSNIVQSSMSAVNGIADCVSKVEDLCDSLDPVKWFLIDLEFYLADLSGFFLDAFTDAIHDDYSKFGEINEKMNHSLGTVQALLGRCEKRLAEISSPDFRDYSFRYDPITGEETLVYWNEIDPDELPSL